MKLLLLCLCRAIIAEVNIRPIDLNVRQLGGKRTAGKSTVLPPLTSRAWININ